MICYVDRKRSFVDKAERLAGKISYSACKDKTRCFPRDHIMEKTQCSSQGARILMKEIFQNNQKSKRIVKGLRDSVDIFVTFLKRHKSCPMKVLLEKNCPTGSSFTEHGKIEDIPFFKVFFHSFYSSIVMRGEY